MTHHNKRIKYEKFSTLYLNKLMIGSLQSDVRHSIIFRLLFHLFPTSPSHVNDCRKTLRATDIASTIETGHFIIPVDLSRDNIEAKSTVV